MDSSETRTRFRRRTFLALAGTMGVGLLAACGGETSATITASTVGTAAGNAATTSAATASSSAPASASTSLAVATMSSRTATPASAATSSGTATSAATAASTAPLSTSAASVSSAAPVASSSRVAAAPGELRYTTQNTEPPMVDAEEKVVRLFEQQNNTKVSYELFKSDDLQQKLVVLAAGGTSPDAADIESKWMPGFYAQKMLLDLTSYADRAKITPEAYYPQEWTKHHIGGKLVAMPLDLQPIVIFYNKDIFASRGVALPPANWDDPTWTWDELLARAQKLTSGTGQDRVYGIVIGRNWRESYPVIWGNGGTVLNADHTASTITMQETTDSIQFRADLINKYKVQPTPEEAKTAGSGNAPFINGRYAMYTSNVTDAFYLANKKADLNYDFAPMPRGKAGAFTRNPADSVMVAAGTKSPDKAFALAAFITGEEGQRQLVAKAGLGVPPLRKVAESDDFLKPQQKGVSGRNFPMVLDMLQKGHYKFQDVTTVWPEMVKILGDAHEQVLQGKITATDMARQVDGPINELLKKVPEAARGFVGD